MALQARYQDGRTAQVRLVTCSLVPGEQLEISNADGQAVDHWSSGDVFALPSRENELRIGAVSLPYGARLVFSGYEDIAAVRQMLPALAVRRRREWLRQVRILGLATAGLGAVLVAYILGVPLLASRLVKLVPTAWETAIGDKAAAQFEAALAVQGDAVCDPNPNSTANRAISRFADAVMDGSGSPFHADIKVVRSETVNAFALPGGHAYYLSALLDKTDTPDEFAGVMAHELGHVANRHGMQSLISSSATGLLIGFVLGDMTGLSIAAGLGESMINSRFSREDESQADAFAAVAAGRVGFDATGLPDLLDKVAKDSAESATFAFLSDHPLTAERRRVLEQMAASTKRGEPVFTDAEWRAIKAMCGPPKAN